MSWTYALKSKFELADALTDKAKIECQAFTRDGGAVSVSIWVRMPDDWVRRPEDELQGDEEKEDGRR
jgi:hypothetical protein